MAFPFGYDYTVLPRGVSDDSNSTKKFLHSASAPPLHGGPDSVALDESHASELSKLDLPSSILHASTITTQGHHGPPHTVDLVAAELADVGPCTVANNEDKFQICV